MFSGPCKEARDAADLGDEGPAFGAGDGFLRIPGKPAASTEPCECALDDPAVGDDPEALRDLRALEDLDCTAPDLHQRAVQLHYTIDDTLREMLAAE